MPSHIIYNALSNIYVVVHVLVWWLDSFFHVTHKHSHIQQLGTEVWTCFPTFER